MNNDKKIMGIFAQAYKLLAEASGQQPTQEGFQQMLEMLGDEGIQECAKVADQGPQTVAQAMVQIIKQKSAQKAANGAKLNYLLKLKGHCPSGYLKKGGRCKKCEQKEKMNLLQGGGDVKSKGNRVHGMYAQKEYNKLPFDQGFMYRGSAPHGDIFFHNNYYNQFNPETERPEVHSYDENFTPVSKDIQGVAKSPQFRYNKQMQLRNLMRRLRASDVVSEEEGGSIDKSKYEINMSRKQKSEQQRPMWMKPGRYNSNPTNGRPVFPNPAIQNNDQKPMPQYESPQSPYPYRITREIYEPQIPGFMPGIEGYPRHYNGGVLKSQGGAPAKKQGGGSILNRIYSYIADEGVNGVGTRFNPVQLREVNVYGEPVDASIHDNYTWYYTNYPHRTSTDYLQYPGGVVYARTVEASPAGNDTTYDVWSKDGQTYRLTGSDFDNGIKNAQIHYGHPYSTEQAPRRKDRGKPINGKPKR